MSLLTTSQKADLRVAIIDELVAAHTVAFPIETIMRRVQRANVLDFEFSQVETAHELDALVSLDLVKVIPDAVTRVINYQPTTKGIVARS
jgi:hypothetical protein